MINKQLKVGDYVFTANGNFAKVIKINKQTYVIQLITYSESFKMTIPFDGVEKDSCYGTEWFYCDDAQAKALELAIKKYYVVGQASAIYEDIKELIGKAKYFLEQIADIDVVYPKEGD